MLKGLMMDRPLSISSAIEYAAATHPKGEVVSAAPDGSLHRYTYADARKRVVRMAHALIALGIKPGDRVATLAFNGYRHLELYYAISGIGAVCHTINPRLFADQLDYIVNHAKDQILFFDPIVAPLVGQMRSRWPAGLKYVAMADAAETAKLQGVPGVIAYETLLENRSETIDWPTFDENTAAALCYTSGTTGNPKGALYSHRSNMLHALFSLVAMLHMYGPRIRYLPVVPLFHVNAWGLPYIAPLTGTSLVMPGVKLDGPSLFDLMDKEHVHCVAGVPTVWRGLLDEMRKRGRRPDGLTHLMVGGSAAPRSLIEAFEKEFNVSVLHGWGMTEMSPIGTVSCLEPDMEALPIDQQIGLKEMQGRAIYGVDMRIVDENGKPLPHDGVAFGELCVRGATIAKAYFEDAKASEKLLDKDGWMRTGDVAKIRPDGFLQIVDRAKDLIKSGGEWISSLDLEIEALKMPAIAQCAVLGIKHPKWDERPVLIVQLAQGAKVTKDEILAFLTPRLGKWQIPDDVIFVDALPLTATGKISKLQLRQKFADYKLPTAG